MNMRNLKILRQSTKETQADLAAILGVDRTTYAKYESGASEPSFETLQKIAQHFGVTSGYLMGEAGAPKRPRAGVRIPVYRAVAAGIPIEATDEIVDWEEIEPELAGTGKYFALRVQGQSMEPRICDGDVVVVRQQEDASTGDTAIVLVNGYEATCKRIKKDGHGIALIPNNPSYEVKYYSAEEISSLPVRIIGKVVELRGKF